MKKAILLLFVALFITSFTAQAEEKKEESALKITGYVDAYYAYNFNKNPIGTSFTNSHNSFELGMANVVFSQQVGKVGFVADLGFGKRADVANGNAGSTLQAVKQLYVTYAPTTDLTITAGNFATFVGYEMIDAPLNFNYSMSYMFTNGPFYHTGVKASYTFAPGYSLMLGAFDDTDSKFDANDINHFGAQLAFAPVEGFSGYLNVLHGREMTSVKGTQIDLTASYKASEQLLIGLNGTYKMYSVDISGADDASWAGAALYLNYTIDEAYGIGCRAEYFDDPDGLKLGVPDGSNVIGLTVSGKMKSGPLTFIPEFRVDIASEDIFIDSDGKPTSSSPMVIFGVVYGF
ncbi:MAG: porin [Chlorobiales bacterium]|nr:porin [Chlorobiales bacterium]